MTINVGFGSETFEFKSKYPNLHMPGYPVNDASLINYKGTTFFLDGEWGLLDGTTRKVKRPAGGDLAGVGQLSLHHLHANPGRSDVQLGQIPYVLDTEYEFITRLHAGNSNTVVDAPVVGEAMAVILDDVNINGVTHTGRTILRDVAAVVGATHFVAICLAAPGTDGWARFITRRGTA